MPGPPKQFDREKALRSTMQVFWRRGFEATSIEELVSAVGINRSSMYSTFGDKKSLFLEALQLYADVQIGELTDLLRGRGKPLNRIKRAFRALAQKASEDDFNGCFAGNTATELGLSDEDAARIVRSAMTRWHRVVKDVLDEAVETGELAEGTDTTALAAFMLTFFQGIGVTAQVKLPAGNVNKLIDGLMRTATSAAWQPA
jgi:TetR/AcrR family transcriptional repressor of nem operon